MKRYTFGELLVYMREEYKEVKPLLQKLKECIQVSPDANNYYFKADLSLENKIRLQVSKEYLKLLKQIQRLRYDWYSEFLYKANFDVVKSDSSATYHLRKESFPTPILEKHLFKPTVSIIKEEEFNALMNQILSLDVFSLKRESIMINHDIISLNLGDVFISSILGEESFVVWNGVNDTIDYSVKRNYYPYLLEEILNLEVPSDYITPEWLKLIEKQESKFKKDFFFQIDMSCKSHVGLLKIGMEEKNTIRLSRK